MILHSRIGFSSSQARFRSGRSPMTALFVGPCWGFLRKSSVIFADMLKQVRLPSLPSFAMPSAEPNPENQSGTLGAAGGHLP